MATLTKKKLNLGLYTMHATTPTFAMRNYATLDATASGGDQYVADSKTHLRFKNSGSTAIVQITCQTKIRGLLRHIRFSVASGNDIHVPVLPSEYTDTNGYVQITYPTHDAGLTVAAIEMGEDPFVEATA